MSCSNPNLAKQSRLFHTMCGHAGFRQCGGNSLVARERAVVVRSERAVLFCGFVLCNPIFCIVVVATPFVCCSVKLALSRPTGFCLFISLLLRTPAGGARGVCVSGIAFEQPDSQTDHFAFLLCGTTSTYSSVFSFITGRLPYLSFNSLCHYKSSESRQVCLCQMSTSK